ncbi:hypothetical protein SynRS9902_01657 [Synechococcus sp. RS9902]|nr:hypothetical protein SynRS9902_01657 [Synechococcus sp. RS9902]
MSSTAGMAFIQSPMKRDRITQLRDMAGQLLVPRSHGL